MIDSQTLAMFTIIALGALTGGFFVMWRSEIRRSKIGAIMHMARERELLAKLPEQGKSRYVVTLRNGREIEFSSESPIRIRAIEPEVTA